MTLQWDERDFPRANNKVPSSLTQVELQAKYEFLGYFRARRFYILLWISAGIASILTAVVGYYRPTTFMASSISFYSSWWGISATFVVILSGIFFGGDAIASEFQNKTGYYLVPNPIRRSSIYVGKWMAALAASSIILAVYAAITIGNGAYYFGANLPFEFGESLLFSWVYLVSILGVTFAFSSLFKSGSYSILVTAILFLFAFPVIQELISTVAQIEPWFMLTYGASIMGNILTPTGYPPHQIVTHGVAGPFGSGVAGVDPSQPAMTIFSATIPEGLMIMAMYFVAAAILGLILFERKEFD